MRSTIAAHHDDHRTLAFTVVGKNIPHGVIYTGEDIFMSSTTLLKIRTFDPI